MLYFYFSHYSKIVNAAALGFGEHYSRTIATKADIVSKHPACTLWLSWKIVAIFVSMVTQKTLGTNLGFEAGI